MITALLGMADIAQITAYAMGGYTSSGIGTIDGLRFYDRTSIVISAACLYQTWDSASISSSVSGYKAGGGGTYNIYSPQSIVEKLNFASQVTLSAAASLPAAAFGSVGVGSGLSGYYLGGANTSTLNAIIKMSFTTEAMSSLTAVLITAKAYSCGVKSATKGYAVGGIVSISTYQDTNEIDGIEFSSETTINPSASLSVVKIGGSVSSETVGYAIGSGSIFSPSASVKGFKFSDETVISPAAALPYIIDGGAAGVQSSDMGFILGGKIGESAINAIHGLAFSTETISVESATLSVARNGSCGVQG